MIEVGDKEGLEGLEASLGYRFRDREILELALTHASFRNENANICDDNERFEFLGDAVLDLIVGKWLFERLPRVGEGVLTEKKAQIVCEANLARLAAGFDLGRLLKLGRGEEMSGGRTKKSLLANSMEAVVAAVFLDGGYEQATSVVLAWIDEALDESAAPLGDPRSNLQNLVQGEHGVLPVYEVEGVSGDEPSALFCAQVEVPGYAPVRAEGRSKKGAMRAAASKMLSQIKAAAEG